MRNIKTKSKLWRYLRLSAVLTFIAALIIYIGPFLLFIGAMKLDEVSSKINSSKNITELISSPAMKGAQLDEKDNSLTVSWALMSTPMTQVKYASSKDLGRLAVHLYSGPPYDNYKVNKKKLKVEFSNKNKRVFTIFFTGK